MSRLDNRFAAACERALNWGWRGNHIKAAYWWRKAYLAAPGVDTRAIIREIINWYGCL